MLPVIPTLKQISQVPFTYLLDLLSFPTTRLTWSHILSLLGAFPTLLWVGHVLIFLALVVGALLQQMHRSADFITCMTHYQKLSLP